MKRIIASLCLSLFGAVGATAQTVPISPKLFGINYWYYDYASGFDSFNSKKETIKQAGITLVRLGGLLPQAKLALTDIPHFDLAIDRVNSIGATPLMQLPINLAPADIPVWIAHFKAKGIVYWSIGNEPEPTSNFSEWFKGIPVTAGGPIKRENGNTYAEFRDKFVAIARAIKQADPQAIVIGPDFHQFYGTTNASDPLMSYYPAFIADVGTLLENRVPLLDVFSLHYYGYNPELDNKKRFDLLQSYINSANGKRSSRISQLRMAVTEVNATTSTNTGFNPSLIFPWDFETGQFFVSVTRNVVLNGGEVVAPWSVYENNGSKGATDFSTYSANGMPRSSMVHFSMLAKNRRATWMTDNMTGSGGNSIVYFGMTDGDGSTVMLMNTTTIARTYSVRLDGKYSAAVANTKFLFNSANHNPVEWVGNLPVKTTLMFTVDANGKRLKKTEYNKTISDAAQANSAAVPIVTDLTVGGAVAGDSGNITLSALLPAGVARSKVEFYVDGALVGSRLQAPYSFVLDASKLVKGEHSLTVAAFDADGNADRSDPVAFTVVEPDQTPPLTTDNAPHSWVNQDTAVSFTATDAGSGVAATYFTVNGGPQQTGTAVALITEGTHTLVYWSIDKAGNVEQKHTVAVNIDKSAPQVAPLFNAGTNILNLNASDAGSGIASAEVSVDGGTTWTADSGATGFSRDGSQVVLYRVRDRAGNLAAGQTTVQVVTVPVITAPANQVSLEAAAASFDLGSFTDRSADSPWSVVINWGDGSAPDTRNVSAAGAIGASPHTYADNGAYTVTVSVTDRAGSVGSATFKVSVSSVAPVAELSVPATASEGAAVNLALVNPSDASAADMQAGLHYAFSCQGGSLGGATYANSGANPVASCTLDDSGMRTVRARVIDKDDAYSEYSAVIQVANIAPRANLVVAASVIEGASTSVTLSGASDPSSADTQAGFHYAFACGDASLAETTYANSGASASGSCSFADGPAAVQVVRARILDKDGGYTDYSANVGVVNAAPVVGAISAQVPQANSDKDTSVSATFTDAGVYDSHSARIDWGDGSVTDALVSETLGTGTGSIAASHRYHQPALYTVKITVTDKDGGIGSATSEISWQCEGNDKSNGNGLALGQARRCSPASATKEQ